MSARISSKTARALGIKAQHKYRAVRTKVGDLTFDSKKEARRYGELVALQAAGKISGLRFQVPFKLHAGNGNLIGKYVADFVYDEAGRVVVEDVKGFKTPMYRWKKKHLKAEYGIEIQEV